MESCMGLPNLESFLVMSICMLIFPDRSVSNADDAVLNIRWYVVRGPCGILLNFLFMPPFQRVTAHTVG